MLSGLERELNELRRLGTPTSLVVNKRRPLAGVIITTTTSVPAHKLLALTWAVYEVWNRIDIGYESGDILHIEIL